MTEEAWKEKQIRLLVRRDRALELVALRAAQWSELFVTNGRLTERERRLFNATMKLVAIDDLLRVHARKKP